MRAHVIGLARSTARRDHIRRELERVGVEGRFVNSVDGAELTPQEHAELVDEAAVASSPDWLTPGAIGCALSHLNAYRDILATEEHVGLVLEDDAVLPDNLPPLAGEVAGEMSGREIVLLNFRAFQPVRFSSLDGVGLAAGGQILYPMSPRLVSSCAYLVTREACRAMADRMLPIRVAADSWDAHHRNGNLERLRCVVPRPVDTCAEFKSVIDYLPSHSRTQRILRAIERRRIFPLHQLLTAKRSRLERRMSRYEIVDEPSPLALAASP